MQWLESEIVTEESDNVGGGIVVGKISERNVYTICWKIWRKKTCTPNVRICAEERKQGIKESEWITCTGSYKTFSKRFLAFI